MHHLLAYTASVSAGATNADVPGVFDGYASLQNGHYLLPKPLKLLAAYASGTTITGAQVNAPTLRDITLPQIQPLQVGTAPTSLAPMSIYPPGMFDIKATDELALNTSNAAGGAERHIGGYIVGDGSMNIDQGKIITVVATASITAGNLVWGAGSFTLTTGLPVGRYSVVGLDVVGANLMFARLVFPEGGPKPGCLARQALNITPKPEFRLGELGTWGYFDTVSLPGIELFGSAAPTTQTIFIDVIKVR
jgi:hypothetical protein